MSKQNNPEKQKTVQSLLAAKKDKTKEKDRPLKRQITDVSMDSSSDMTIELGNIHTDLDTIKDSLEGVVKNTDLNKALNEVVKKGDVETIVVSIVTKLLDEFKKEFKRAISDKTDKQSEAIEKLSVENEDLREMIAEQQRHIKDLESKVQDNERVSREAVQMSNYNQQYSRKFNIKVMNLQEKPNENLKEEFVKTIAKEKLDINIDPSDIQAIHRIPGKSGEARPVLVKLLNSDVKYKIMKARKNIPRSSRLRLYDDITKHNMGLLTRLRNSGRLESAWYFNCAIYGKTETGTRIRFDLYDDIDSKIRRK